MNLSPDQIRELHNSLMQYEQIVTENKVEKSAILIAYNGGEGCDRIFVHSNKKAITHALKSIGKWDAITDHNLEMLCESVNETM